jgi:predicted ATP-binding protein involved in virulence
MNFNLKLKSLKIKGFRGFKEPIELIFNEKLTVLIGVNAAGKSAILDAIATYLMYLRHEITRGQLYTFPIPLHPKKKRNYDVNNESNELENIITFEFENPGTSGEVRCILRATQQTMTRPEGYESEEDDAESIENQQLIFNSFVRGIYNGRLTGGLKTIPVMAYYGCNSIRTDIPEDTEELLHFDILDTYREALESKVFNFNQFVLLLDRRQKISLQQPQQKDAFLTALKIVIQEILSEDSNIRYEHLRIHWGLLYDEVVIDKVWTSGTRETISLNQLSSGEQFLLGLVADLTRRLYLANPHSDPLQGNGLVLVDEIDLHLHPRWQQKVLPKLMFLFPNIQFVITTHSPLILSELYSHHIRSIEKGKVYGLRDTYGHQDADDMLQLMGFQSVTRQKIKQIHLLLRENKIAEAQSIRNTIVAEGIFTPLLEIDLFIQRKLRKAS